MESKEEELVRKCNEKVKEIYGENLPNTIKERLKLELDIIRKNNFAFRYLLADDIMKKSKGFGFLVICKGSIGNSFVAYLLEIIDYNPIEFNLPFEFFAGKKFNERHYISFIFSKGGKNKMLRYIDEKYDIVTNEYGEISPIHKINFFENNELTMLKTLIKLTGINCDDIEFNDKDTMNLFAQGETKGISNFENAIDINLIKIIKPRNFNDLVLTSALLYSGLKEYYNCVCFLIKYRNKKINDLLSNQEDFMNYLIYKNIDNEIAYEITKFVSDEKYVLINYEKNNDLYLKKWRKYKDILRAHNVPKWYIMICEKLDYFLSLKAIIITNCELSYRLAYFKAHYPDLFYKVYFEINDDFNMGIYLEKSNREKEIKKLRKEAYECDEEILENLTRVKRLEVLLDMFKNKK